MSSAHHGAPIIPRGELRPTREQVGAMFLAAAEFLNEVQAWLIDPPLLMPRWAREQHVFPSAVRFATVLGRDDAGHSTRLVAGWPGEIGARIVDLSASFTTLMARWGWPVWLPDPAIDAALAEAMARISAGRNALEQIKVRVREIKGDMKKSPSDARRVSRTKDALGRRLTAEEQRIRDIEDQPLFESPATCDAALLGRMHTAAEVLRHVDQRVENTLQVLEQELERRQAGSGPDLLVGTRAQLNLAAGVVKTHPSYLETLLAKGTLSHVRKRKDGKFEMRVRDEAEHQRVHAYLLELQAPDAVQRKNPNKLV